MPVIVVLEEAADQPTKLVVVDHQGEHALDMIVPDGVEVLLANDVLLKSGRRRRTVIASTRDRNRSEWDRIR